MTECRAGDTFEWMECRMIVLYVDEDGSRARMVVVQPATGSFWFKDQSLPLPAHAVRLVPEKHADTDIDLNRPTVTPEQVCPGCETYAPFRIVYRGNQYVAEQCPSCQCLWIPKERR